MKLKSNKKNIKIEKEKIFYHSLNIEEVFTATNSGLEGLTTVEAENRLAKNGKNELPQKAKKSILTILLRELSNPIIILLLFASVFSFITNALIDAFVIIGIISIDAIIGTVQEKRAENIADSLMDLIKIQVKVLRDSEKGLLGSKNLVVGDIVFLESGDKISADMRIIDCKNLKVDESLLTGESANAEKNINFCEKSAHLSERKNMLYAGSSVITGRAMAVVVETGFNTEIGNIAEKIASVKDEKSPLAIRIKKFSKQITVAVAIVALVIFAVLYFQGNNFNLIFLAVIALAVSAIPEGLPLAVTMALSVASNKMSKVNVVVKNLNAVESLGSCTVIASDKTGTLTLNEQTAKLIVLPDGEEFEITGSGYNNEGKVLPNAKSNLAHAEEIGLMGVLNNEAKLYKKNNEFKNFGDSIDVAFLSLGMKLGLDKKDYTLTERISYESEKKYSAVFYQKDNQNYCTAKGSIEKIISLCGKMKMNDKIVELDKNNLIKMHEKLARKGFRVIALAQGEHISELLEENISDLTFLGMVGFIDPIRNESKNAVENCYKAGIKVVMITGDHPLTAYAIAKEIGVAKNKNQITNGTEVEKYFNLGEIAFDKFIKTKTVFSRVTPIEKLNIVNSLKRMGEFVAVTGDGVNDAPAIKTAHIGIAMGSGTDVAKETADMIITDDNFNSIVQGVKEGRNAYSNIRKVTYFLLSGAFAEILFFLFSIAINLPIPLLAIQLLWINIITNGLQDIALSFEKAEKNIMQEKPRSTKESLFSKSLFIEVGVSGLFMGLLVFGVWFYLIDILQMEEIYARSLTMALMIFLENFQGFNCRSETESVFSIPIFSNKIFFVSVISAIVLQIIIMEIDSLSTLLGLTSVSYFDMLLLLALSTVIVVVMELYKLVIRKHRKQSKTKYAY
ncbi:MAG: HAD-IC family P-type ATPase [Clostridia bacterium]|nr:HAD-IC family P-type ATPase [Clostridia bacterium]